MLDKTFDPKSIEQKHYKEWEDTGTFACHPESDKTPYTIMMPPPNVTGSLHIGHALNHTLQDILVRYYRLKGRDVLWQPGTDHASIAVHMVLENQLNQEGTNRFELGREKFMKKAWEWKEYSGNTITSQLRSLGTTPDWGREAFTMDEGLSKAVLKAFVDLYNDKLIYRDERLVNWDPERQTVISDLEVNYKEVKGKMYHFRYPYEDGSGFVSVATTRPETILADGAVAVHPEDDRYKDLVGKFVVVPIVNRIIPVIADDYVDPEFGSGAVKITAAHDFNDFEVYKRHPDAGIPIINLFTPDAKMNENTPKDYQGLDRFEARKKVVEDFDDLEYLDKIEDHVHQVPFGDRSGTIIEPYLTKQWFCDTPTLAKPAAKAVRDGKSKFVPKQYENMYFAWVDEQLPWCISRQLWWGHQIPAWYDENGEVYVAESEEEAQKLAGEGVKITRDEDVLDTWFSSALWPFSTLGWPDKTPELDKYYPGDVLVTGFDIITFWVSRMMMFSLYFMGEVPFKDIYIHALVRDAKGQKMSKSKGNVMDPLDLIEKYGTDALRFTLCAMATQGRDIRLAEERLEGYRNFATKLWNATRYCEMNDCLTHDGFDPAKATFTPNKWIINEVAQAKKDIDDAMEGYRFNDAANAVYHFVWGTFCDWYLEFTKPVLQEGGEAADEVRQTTAWALEQILTLLNPFMPFITEELYASIGKREKDERLLTSKWPEYSESLIHNDSVQKMSWLQDTITEIRSVRADMNVPAKAEIDLLVKGACDKTKEGFDAFGEILSRMAKLSKIEFVDEAPKGSIQTVVGQTTLILPIADIIDLDAERERLSRAIGKLDEDISKIDSKLSNKKFVQNAPEEVIEEQKSRKSEVVAKREKLEQALKQLEEAA